MKDPLAAFFAPSTIAIVGASDDPAKWGHIIARQSLRHRGRTTFFVNSRADTVLGLPVHRSLTGIGQAIDLAIVSVPVGAFRAVIDDAVSAGVRAVLAITAGFAELGPEGEALQRECATVLRTHGVRMIGPNCLGLVDNGSGVYLAANDFAAGSVALLSQSGNLALELDVMLRRAGMGFSRFISIGNQADVSLVELMDSCVADPNTAILALYVEDFRDGRAFIEAAQRARAAGKPVIVLASGNGPAAARSAGSHTGALSSNAEVVAMACATAGAVNVHTPRQMLVALQSVGRAAHRVRRVGIVTDGGGHGTIAAGLLEDAGFALPTPDSRLSALLRRRLWAPSSVTNPVDLAGYGEQDPRSYAATTALMLADATFDAVLMTGYFGGYSSPVPFAAGLGEGEVAAARAIVRAVHKQHKPVVVHSMATESTALDVLRAAGVPTFDAIEDAVAALGLAATEPSVPLLPIPEPGPPIPTDYHSLREAMRDAGLPSGRVIPVADQGQIAAAVAVLKGPYVLKTAAALHKSDSGGVRLNLADEAALMAAHAEMTLGIGDPHCTVESMVDLRDAVELLVGVKWDPRFGPVMMVGAGGVLAEVAHDTALACAPVDAEQGLDLLHSLDLAPLLGGFRGRPAIAIEAAADVIARLGAFAAAHPEWSEFEVNPLVVTPFGTHILDARAID